MSKPKLILEVNDDLAKLLDEIADAPDIPSPVAQKIARMRDDAEMTTMTDDDLLRFCHPSRVHITAPITVGAYTYATDGRLAIRVARGDRHSTRARSSVSDALERLMRPPTAPDYQPVQVVDLPAIPPCTFSEMGISCVPPCPTCSGSGFDDLNAPPALVGPYLIARSSAVLLQTLPGCEIDVSPAAWYATAPGGVPDGTFPTIRFDGGIGVLVPLVAPRCEKKQARLSNTPTRDGE